MQGKHTMILKHLVVPEIEDVFKAQKGGSKSKGHREPN